MDGVVTNSPDLLFYLNFKANIAIRTLQIIKSHLIRVVVVSGYVTNTLSSGERIYGFPLKACTTHMFLQRAATAEAISSDVVIDCSSSY